MIGQLPTCQAGKAGHRSTRVMLYVPKRLKPNHRLVQILGEAQAAKLIEGFGGEILQPANCQEVYRRWRDSEARRMASDGMAPADIAEIMNVTARHIRNLTREVNSRGLRAANDDCDQ
ncbi:hypothetical protein GCM10011349_11860 [Novosphingobium indicum]|uniref:Mor transcription activator domain-containing protein n=1 Tax=Novosphingobium indicum TaxID=462949 RepID=A0ABQ2JIL0_9SPHN|nr:hypothetical protein GCM10011349_11860 [Novosphingobium indicum]